MKRFNDLEMEKEAYVINAQLAIAKCLNHYGPEMERMLLEEAQIVGEIPFVARLENVVNMWEKKQWINQVW